MYLNIKNSEDDHGNDDASYTLNQIGSLPNVSGKINNLYSRQRKLRNQTQYLSKYSSNSGTSIYDREMLILK